jgi:hypothetical protein
MELGHYQLHTDRVISNQKVNVDYLSCFLCKNILWQPEKCNDCSTHFCRFCIRFSLLKSRKCPTCLNEYYPVSPDHYLVEDLNNLQVKCVHTYSGCNKILVYKSMSEHENECIYKEKVCEECNTKILKKSYHTHIVLCKNSVSQYLAIDFHQIVMYFQEKLEKLQKENMEEIDKLKKTFVDVYTQKEIHLGELLQKLEKQKKLLEEILNDREKMRCQMMGEGNMFYEECMKLGESHSNNSMVVQHSDALGTNCKLV